MRPVTESYSRSQLQEALVAAVGAALADLGLDADGLDGVHARRLARALLHLAARTACHLRWPAKQYLGHALEALAVEAGAVNEVAAILAGKSATMAKA